MKKILDTITIKNYDYIDFYRGLAIIFVVLIHITGEKYDILSQSIFHRLAVPQFVIITGFLLNLYKDRPYFNYLTKHLKDIIYIYFVSLIISYLSFNKEFNIIILFAHIIDGTHPVDINLPLYYIPFYISLFTISWSLIKISSFFYNILSKHLKGKFYYKYIILLILSLIIALIGYNIKSTTVVLPFYYKHSMILQIFAVFGYVLYDIDKKIDYIFFKANKIFLKSKNMINNKHIFKILIIIFTISWFTFLIISAIEGRVDVYNLEFKNIFLFYLSSILGSVVLFMLSKIICNYIADSFLVRIINIYGKYSIYICVIHMCIVSIIDYLKFKYPLLSYIMNNNYYIGVTIQCIILCSLSSIFGSIFKRTKYNIKNSI